MSIFLGTHQHTGALALVSGTKVVPDGKHFHAIKLSTQGVGAKKLSIIDLLVET